MTDRPDDLIREARSYEDDFFRAHGTHTLIGRLADALEAAQKERDEALVAYRTYRQVAKFHTTRVRQLEEALTRVKDVRLDESLSVERAEIKARTRMREIAREVLAAKENTTP